MSQSGRAMLRVTEQFAKLLLKVGQGHRKCHHSKALVQFPICLP